MNLDNVYWVFKKAVPVRTCNHILEHAKKLKFKKGLVGGKTKFEEIKQHRDSHITWLCDRWIYRTISPFIEKANINAGWNFQWDESEKFQFTVYNKNQYYNWHYDSIKAKPTGKVRKLSAVVSLNKKEDYEGGRLQFLNNLNFDSEIIECPALHHIGSIVVFPSFIWHRVKPVTKGTRKVLVGWVLGNQWS